jgi:hypothetical protein
MIDSSGNIIAMALSAGAAKQIAAVSSLGDDKTILAAKYGSHVIDNLHEAVKGYPTLAASHGCMTPRAFSLPFCRQDSLSR